MFVDNHRIIKGFMKSWKCDMVRHLLGSHHYHNVDTPSTNKGSICLGFKAKRLNSTMDNTRTRIQPDQLVCHVTMTIARQLPIFSITLLIFTGLAVGIGLVACSSQTQSTQGSLVDVTVKEIALMPFLTGQMASPDAPIATLSAPRDTETAIIDNVNLPDGTDLIMNQIVNTELKIRFAERLIPPDLVSEAYQPLLMAPQLNTPRKRAIGLGKTLKANLVMVGTIWWYRERGALTQLPDNPASVGFELCLFNVETGARLWRGRFEGTQEALADDLLGGVERLNMGLRWLSARELARYGVKSVLRKLPLE